MNFKIVLTTSILLLFMLFQAKSQQCSVATLLAKVDEQVTSASRCYYLTGYCFKSAPEIDTGSMDGRVHIFADGFYPNDTLKSFVILSPDGKFTYAFDGKYFYSINHIIKTFAITDIGEKGIKKAMSGSASNFIYPPFIRKRQRHFLDHFYTKSVVLSSPLPDFPYFVIENIDSTVNKPKIAEFDPDYIVTRTVLEISSVSFNIRKMMRWVTFMATPQYEEVYYSEVSSLPDSITFQKCFDLEIWKQSGYIEYDEYKRSLKRGAQPIHVKEGGTFPRFVLPDYNHQIIYSDSITTGIILIDFWYRSCYPCLKAMPMLELLHQEYADKGLHVFGINSRDAFDSELKRFMLERKVNYPALIDEKGVFAKSLNITGYPTLFLIDAASKKVLLAQTGYSESTEEALKALLQKSF